MKLRITTNFSDCKYILIEVKPLYCLIESRDIVVRDISDNNRLTYICTTEMLEQ